MGEVEEERIDNMSYVFFQSVLAALGKKLSFESVSNLYGRTVFDKKGGESIAKSIEMANPLTKPNTKNSAAVLMSMPGTMSIIDMQSNNEAPDIIKGFEEFFKEGESQHGIEGII